MLGIIVTFIVIVIVIIVVVVVVIVVVIVAVIVVIIITVGIVIVAFAVVIKIICMFAFKKGNVASYSPSFPIYNLLESQAPFSKKSATTATRDKYIAKN